MTTSGIVNRLGDTGDRIEKQASEVFRTGRTVTADTLDAAAEKLEAGGDRIAATAHKTAEQMEKTANYVRSHGGHDMLGDVEAMIKKHPGKAVLGAVVAGFLLGRAFRRE